MDKVQKELKEQKEIINQLLSFEEVKYGKLRTGENSARNFSKQACMEPPSFGKYVDNVPKFSNL